MMWLAPNGQNCIRERPSIYFAPRNNELESEYAGGRSVQDIFPVNSVGIATARDKLTIQWTREDLLEVVDDFVAREPADARDRYSIPTDSSDWKVSDAQRDLREHPNADEHVASILYRPFDLRATYYTGRAAGFMVRPRRNVMHHMLQNGNLSLGTVRNREIDSDWQHVFVSNVLATHHTVSVKEVNHFFPLYLLPKQ